MSIHSLSFSSVCVRVFENTMNIGRLATYLKTKE